MKNLLIFDVCDTLVNTNSTTEYINFLINHNLWNKKYRKLLKNKYFLFCLHIIRKYTNIDIQRKITFRFFKWIYVHDEEKLKKEFFSLYLSKKTKIMDKLIESKDNKSNEVFLLSASINQPIDMLSQYLWVKSYSTKLVIKNNKYTGKVYYDLLWNKEYILKRNINIYEYEKCMLYTDNLSDFPLIKHLKLNARKLKVYPIIKNIQKENTWKNFLLDNNIDYEFIY